MRHTEAFSARVVASSSAAALPVVIGWAWTLWIAHVPSTIVRWRAVPAIDALVSSVAVTEACPSITVAIFSAAAKVLVAAHRSDHSRTDLPMWDVIPLPRMRQRLWRAFIYSFRQKICRRINNAYEAAGVRREQAVVFRIWIEDLEGGDQVECHQPTDPDGLKTDGDLHNAAQPKEG